MTGNLWTSRFLAFSISSGILGLQYLYKLVFGSPFLSIPPHHVWLFSDRRRTLQRRQAIVWWPPNGVFLLLKNLSLLMENLLLRGQKFALKLKLPTTFNLLFLKTICTLQKGLKLKLKFVIPHQGCNRGRGGEGGRGWWSWVSWGWRACCWWGYCCRSCRD